jgi:hypothetical protein
MDSNHLICTDQKVAQAKKKKSKCTHFNKDDEANFKKLSKAERWEKRFAQLLAYKKVVRQC